MVVAGGARPSGRRGGDLEPGIPVFAKQNVGICEVTEHIWLVTFMHYDLGFFDLEGGRVQCAPNPFAAEVLPMCPE